MDSSVCSVGDAARPALSDSSKGRGIDLSRSSTTSRCCFEEIAHCESSRGASPPPLNPQFFLKATQNANSTESGMCYLRRVLTEAGRVGHTKRHHVALRLHTYVRQVPNAPFSITVHMAYAVTCTVSCLSLKGGGLLCVSLLYAPLSPFLRGLPPAPNKGIAQSFGEPRCRTRSATRR